MRTIQTTVYQFDELTDKAKEKARDWYRDATAGESYYLEDIYGSLKATFKAAGIKLTDWSLGPYNRSNQVTFDMGNAGELTGARALAWLENNLFEKVRITPAEFAERRKDFLSYGPAYRVGRLRPCPFTGMCYDDDYIDSLVKDIKSGDTLRDAFRNLADVCGRLCEQECEYQNEDDTVDESIRANEYEFTEDGKRS